MICVLEDHYNGIIGDNLVMSMQVFRGFLWKPAGNWEEGTSLLGLLPLVATYNLGIGFIVLWNLTDFQEKIGTGWEEYCAHLCKRSTTGTHNDSFI